MNETLISSEAAPETEERDFVVAEDAAPERPEWLPEKYNSAEDLAKAYKELESKLGTKEEDMRAKFKEEYEADKFAERPATSGEYALPDFVDSEEAVDNELLKWWADEAYNSGYNQDQFEKGIEMYLQSVEGSAPDLDAEAAKLGENADQRIESASMFATKFFPEQSMPAIERMFETHEGILAVEAIQEAMKDGNFAGDTAPSAGLTEDNLREMMQDPRYWSKNDPAYVRQVEAGFKKIYGS
tara:strand:- start:35 stop:760 length:726 start_codon:yes stop_codon:yes gene_type:complete